MAAALVVIVVVVVVLVGIFVYQSTLVSIETPETPSASFSSAEQDSASTMNFTFGDAEQSIRYLDLKVILHINNTNRDVYLGTYPFDPSGTGYVNEVAGGQNYSVSYDDVDSDGVVESGEHLGVTYLSGMLPEGDYTVYLLSGTGSVITSAHVLV